MNSEERRSRRRELYSRVKERKRDNKEKESYNEEDKISMFLIQVGFS